MRRFLPWVLLGLVVVAVVAGLAGVANRHPVVADTVGYVSAGRRLADGDGLSWRDDVNVVAGPFSSPMAYPVRRGDPDELRFGYPAAYPAVIAAAVAVSGREGAATLVPPAMGGLLVLATALLTGALLRSAWAALAAGVVMAAVPDLWRFATDAWADVPAAAVAAGGVAAVVVATGAGTWSARARVVAGAAGGGLLGALCWLRPAGVVVVAAVGVAALLARPGRAPLLAAVGVLGALGVGLLAFNARWYGSAFSTGYSVEHGWYPQPAFALRYAFGPSFIDGYSATGAARMLGDALGPLLVAVPIGLVALGRRRGLVVAAAVAGAVGPYLVYAFRPTGENARFLLPALPFLVAAAVGAVVAAARRFRAVVVVPVAAAVAVAALVPGAVDARADARRAAADGERLAGAAAAIAARTPADAVLLSYDANDAIAVYGGRSVLNVRRMSPADPGRGRYRTDLLPGCLTGAVRALVAAGRPVVVVDGPTPPSIDPLPILRAAFRLERLPADPALWQVAAPLPGAPRGSVEPCREASID